MNVTVDVLQDLKDGSIVVWTRISDADGAQVGEFSLPGGASPSEAEALARSIIRLAATGFDLRKLVPDC